jgi:hypothetical protein
MGGLGSGRPRQKPVLEDGLPLDIGKLLRDGLIRSGAFTGNLVWRTTITGEETASAGFTGHLIPETRTGLLELRYRVTNSLGERHDIREPIRLEARPQPYGGLMWFFRCPVTGRRCRKFWLVPGGRRFAARQAWRVGYRSQRETPYDRAIAQAHKIRDRLDASPVIGDWVDRPKGMHRRTFERYLGRLERHESVCEAHLAQLVGRLLPGGSV